MSTQIEIYQLLLERTQGTPYTVTQITDGLRVHLNVADLNWMTLLQQHHLDKEYSIEVVFDEARHSYTQEQITRELTWTAGSQPGTFLPHVSASRNVQRGTMVEKSYHLQLGLNTDTGRLGPVGYAFDSTKMAHVVDEVMKPSGWRKTIDSSTRIGLIVAGSVVGGLLLAGVITLVVLLLV
jgi:hypothetical protein